MSEPNVVSEFSRIVGEECAGACKHSKTYHLAKYTRPDGVVEMGCCKVDCRCMDYVAPKKEVVAPLV